MLQRGLKILTSRRQIDIDFESLGLDDLDPRALAQR
jgi:hypothetical protein